MNTKNITPLRNKTDFISYPMDGLKYSRGVCAMRDLIVGDSNTDVDDRCQLTAYASYEEAREDGHKMNVFYQPCKKAWKAAYRSARIFVRTGGQIAFINKHAHKGLK